MLQLGFVPFSIECQQYSIAFLLFFCLASINTVNQFNLAPIKVSVLKAVNIRH